MDASLVCRVPTPTSPPLTERPCSSPDGPVWEPFVAPSGGGRTPPFLLGIPGQMEVSLLPAHMNLCSVKLMTRCLPLGMYNPCTHIVRFTAHLTLLSLQVQQPNPEMKNELFSSLSSQNLHQQNQSQPNLQLLSSTDQHQTPLGREEP